MSWPIRYFESIEAVYAEYGDRGPWPIGTMYPDPEYLEHWIGGKPLISPEYRASNASRPPLSVELPCGHFCVDMVTMQDGVPGDHGWAVSGSPPLLTLTPSVNIKGGWHGYITNGVICDDVEGKTFPERRPERPDHSEHGSA